MWGKCGQPHRVAPTIGGCVEIVAILAILAIPAIPAKTTSGFADNAGALGEGDDPIILL